MVIFLAFSVATVDVQAKPPRQSEIVERACKFGPSIYYCLADAAKRRSIRWYEPATVDLFGSDAEGVPLDCKNGKDGPDLGVGSVTCEVVAKMYRYPPNQAPDVKVGSVTLEWDVSNLSTYAGKSVPSVPAKLLRDGYKPLRPGGDASCTNLSCLWTYPRTALRADRSGTATVSIAVDVKGIATECRPFVSSGSADLDWITCARFLDWARFTPALDSDGTPRQSVLTIAMPYRVGG